MSFQYIVERLIDSKENSGNIFKTEFGGDKEQWKI